jgi:hypothetical protein
LKGLDELIAKSPELQALYVAGEHPDVGMRYPAPRPRLSPPLEFLPIYSGYECHICFFATGSKDVMWDHYNNVHKIKGRRLVAGAVTRCPLQIWSTTCHKSYRAWWRVDAATALTQLRQVKAEEARQIEKLQNDRGCLSSDKLTCPLSEGFVLTASHADDENPYLKRTGWVEVFNARPSWSVLRHATYLPRKERSTPSRACSVLLPFGKDTPHTSEVPAILRHNLRNPSASLPTDGAVEGIFIGEDAESVVLILLEIFDSVLSRCLETLAITPVLHCQWLTSYSVLKPWKHAFRVGQNQETMNKYFGSWRRMLCLIFRAFQLSEDSEREIFNLLHRLSEQEYSRLKVLWGLGKALFDFQVRTCNTSSCSNDEAERQKSMHLARLEEIEERLLEFSVGLLTQEIHEQKPVSNNLLLYTVGILSLDVEHHGFTRTTTSSSHIAGFLWVGRLLLLEYALPKKAHVLLQWPARSAFPQPINRLREVHSCFLVPQHPSVIGELITIKSYARAVQHYDLVAYHLFFSDDLQSIQIDSQCLEISAFKQWIHDSIY